jgi:pyrophosphate--fructose-6-phosphate 1-phosphotransferase
MGRSASHIALECALQTHPNACIISEEVQQKNISLNQIVWDLTNLVIKRASKKLNFGVVLVPEGLIEFVPELNPLIAELNDSMAEGTELGDQFNALPDMDAKIKFVEAHLKGDNLAVFKPLPTFVKAQLLGDRDPHGNVQVSKIETEKLLIAMVEANIKAYNGATGNNVKFSTQAHFFGYEGRCAAPSNFDADYCYALGYNASALIANDLTGYMSSVRNTSKSADKWEAGGIPLTMMMNMEHRHGKDVPVIKKALVELDAKPFKTFAANRDKWAEEVDFVYPGPIQYFGPAEVCDRTTLTLQLERA